VNLVQTAIRNPGRQGYSGERLARGNRFGLLLFFLHVFFMDSNRHLCLVGGKPPGCIHTLVYRAARRGHKQRGMLVVWLMITDRQGGAFTVPWASGIGHLSGSSNGIVYKNIARLDAAHVARAFHT